MKRRTFNINELIRLYQGEAPCDKTIRKALLNKELPGFIKPNGRWAIKLSDFDNWLNPSLPNNSEYATTSELTASWKSKSIPTR